MNQHMRMHQVIGHMTHHGLVTHHLMIPSSNKNVKHVRYGMWNMCNAKVITLECYVSKLFTSPEGGPSGRGRADMSLSASIKLEEFIPSDSHSASSMAMACSCPCPTCLIADVHSHPVSYVRSQTEVINEGIPKMHRSQVLQLSRDISSWWFQHQNQIHTCHPHQRTWHQMRGYPMDQRAWEENGRLPVGRAVAGWVCWWEGSYGLHACLLHVHEFQRHWQRPVSQWNCQTLWLHSNSPIVRLINIHVG